MSQHRRPGLDVMVTTAGGGITSIVPDSARNLEEINVFYVLTVNNFAVSSYFSCSNVLAALKRCLWL